MNLFNPFRLLKKLQQPEHVHSWKPIAVKHGVTQGRYGQDATQILRSCSCGDFSTFIVLGHWELHEVQAGGVLEELEKMVSL